MDGKQANYLTKPSKEEEGISEKQQTRNLGCSRGIKEELGVKEWQALWPRVAQ